MTTTTRSVDWRDQAACAGQDTTLWFGDKTTAAVEICRSCPVRAECLYDALQHEGSSYAHRYGIRGGLGPSERKHLPPLPDSKRDALAALRELLPTPPTEGSRPVMTAAAELPVVDVQLKDSADVRLKTAEVYAEALPVGQLLKWAADHPDAGIRDQAERARMALAALRERHAADRELTAISSEAEQLEQRLAELRAREAALAPAKAKRKRGSYVRDYDAREVRAWAEANGVECARAGQIPKRVLDAWRAASRPASA